MITGCSTGPPWGIDARPPALSGTSHRVKGNVHSLGRTSRRCPPRSTAAPTMLSAGRGDRPLLRLSTGPVFPPHTTFIVMRTLCSLRPAALPGTGAGGSLRAQDWAAPALWPIPPPLSPSGWVPQPPPGAEQDQLPGTLANGGPLSMMRREALPSLTVGAWDLRATCLTQEQAG